MGTRSSIFVKKTDNKGITKFYRFYKHWDGYPTGNLSLIINLLVLDSKVKQPIKKLMALASELDNQKSEYEGTKSTLNEIVSHNEHGDLEWTYLVDLDQKSVDIAESQNGTSDALLANKLTDPLKYVNRLIESARSSESLRTKEYVNRINSLGFKVNRG